MSATARLLVVAALALAGCGDDDANGGPDGGAGGPDGGAGGPDGGGGGACGEIVTFETGRAPGAELHVAEGGDDGAGDGSAGSPFATIGRAAQAAAPGTAIRVHAGTYGGGSFIDGLAGTADAPIWIGGAPGEARPVIEGGAEGLHLTRVRYLVVHDLEIRNAASNGVNCDDGGEVDDPDATRYVVFRGLYIHDIGSGGNEDCLKLSGLDDYFVLDSELAACGGGGSGSGVDHVGCHHGLLARNFFHDNSGNAIQCKGGSVDIEIRGNRIVNPGERGVNMGGSTGLQYFRPSLSTTQPNAEARDIRVVANLIVGGVAPLAFVGCVDCLAAHNTIVDPENWLLRILQETTTGGGYEFLPASGGRFVNNVVYFDRSAISTYVNIGVNTAPETFVFSHNLWFAHDAPGQSQPTDLPVAETAGLYGEDPQFQGEWPIAPASPAAGTGLAGVGVAADFTGACFADPPSRGAWEVGSP